MITVSRFDQSEFILNADLIEFIEAKPDTYITLITGKKIVVHETPQEVVARVLHYRREAGRLLCPSVAALPAADAGE